MRNVYVFLLLFSIISFAYASVDAEYDTITNEDGKVIRFPQQIPGAFFYGKLFKQNEGKRIKPPSIIDVPTNCPQGTKPDANGQCREIW